MSSEAFLSDAFDATADRRTAVLQAALSTFARYGYRKTSMEQVARDAHISRPGLYFLFSSKRDLFQEAIERSVREDLAAVEHALVRPDDSLQQRLLLAFDHWAGRYIGPLTREVALLVEDSPSMVGPVVRAAPQQFAQLITDAVATQLNADSAERVAQTLIAASIGIKHQADDRAAYLAGLEIAVDLLLTPSGPASS